MLEFSKKTNQLMQSKYKYQLQDVEEPNLYREIFDYESMPEDRLQQPSGAHARAGRDLDDGYHLPGRSAERQPLYARADRARSSSWNRRLGGPKGLIRQSEFFLYTDKDREALETCQELGLRVPGDHHLDPRQRKGLRAGQGGGREGDGHPGFLQRLPHLQKDAPEPLRRPWTNIWASSRRRWISGIAPRCHFEDITRADFYGFVLPFAEELMNLCPGERHAHQDPRLRHHGLRRQLSRRGPAPQRARHHLRPAATMRRFPSAQLEWHGHNDFYKVVTNAGTAWLYGCSSVNCSLLGIGERTGNCPLEAMAIEYAGPARHHRRHGPDRRHRDRRVSWSGRSAGDQPRVSPSWAVTST